MITKQDISAVLSKYNKNEITIATLGGHSALDVCRGAHDQGFRTLVVAQRGRHEVYEKHYKTNGDLGCVDEVLVVDNFKDVTSESVQKELVARNAIFIHSRYFWVYCDYDQVESNFLVPIFGNRILVKKEERDETQNQYYLLEKAGIKLPKQFANYKDIDTLVIVKANEKERSYERDFFLVGSPQEYESEMIKRFGNTFIEHSPVIEEFVVGPMVNLNFFYSGVEKRLELMGTDIRRQTNIDGLLRLTAPEQEKVLQKVQPKYIENGHIAVTVKESLLGKIYELGEQFVKAVDEVYPPGMIGPFALQGAVTAGPPTEEIYIFDVSMRIPGSPGTMFTPYSGYMHGQPMSYGKRIAVEIKEAINQNKLEEIVT
ncbi:5-formaminoimidazole-4-carboxamide-1-(beta)-D-ribofuranosyl 5'-monophosphate synthetase [Candidatus Saccharibacteria bacterium RIFCSPHIGHO2_12_FULL_41_12]|nr:MAG: 5-formaminoimidazole-4-carboxamide-1-(beta)-D-ribofuranosyl 5'-monophosphate synthetase [Candidatus Saccharibacteria bacterium RIFCSPHIGHO2_12_FULL_41_12]